MGDASSAYDIRPVHASEHEVLGEITVRAYTDRGFLTDENDFYAEHLRDVASRVADAEVLVAADGDRLLGGVTFALPGSPLAEIGGPGEAEIRMLAVDPASHGRGFGSALTLACVERARAEAGIKRVVLCSKDTMTTAHRVYERLGFQRARGLDWMPVPGVSLWGYALEL